MPVHVQWPFMSDFEGPLLNPETANRSLEGGRRGIVGVPSADITPLDSAFLTKFWGAGHIIVDRKTHRAA
jgi:hypothetical protein